MANGASYELLSILMKIVKYHDSSPIDRVGIRLNIHVDWQSTLRVTVTVVHKQTAQLDKATKWITTRSNQLRGAGSPSLQNHTSYRTGRDCWRVLHFNSGWMSDLPRQREPLFHSTTAIIELQIARVLLRSYCVRGNCRLSLIYLIPLKEMKI